MSRQKICPYQKKIAASVAKQYVFEARQRYMSLSSYIAWLKQKAGITTVYDQLNEIWAKEHVKKTVS